MDYGRKTSIIEAIKERKEIADELNVSVTDVVLTEIAEAMYFESELHGGYQTIIDVLIDTREQFYYINNALMNSFNYQTRDEEDRPIMRSIAELVGDIAEHT